MKKVNLSFFSNSVSVGKKMLLFAAGLLMFMFVGLQDVQAQSFVNSDEALTIAKVEFLAATSSLENHMATAQSKGTAEALLLTFQVDLYEEIYNKVREGQSVGTAIDQSFEEVSLDHGTGLASLTQTNPLSESLKETKIEVVEKFSN